MEKVQILMSTYNGAPYLRTQLESIIKQKNVEMELLIRDDGSTDGTQEILEEYVQMYPWMHWFQGQNIGVQKSFFDLLLKADRSIPYFAFSDQDDEWMPEKLNRAITKIQELEHSKNRKHGEKRKNTEAILYCSDKYIVDEQLVPIPVTVSRIVRKISFGNALVQNICTGCTAVFNRELLVFICNHMPKNPDSVIMHDWWLYLAASCFGTVFYDEQPYIRYRQHGKNTSGAMLNKKNLLKYRIKQLLAPRGQIYRQIEEFCEVFHLIDRNKVLAEKVLNSEVSLKGKLELIREKEIFRQKKTDDLIYRGVVLIEKL